MKPALTVEQLFDQLEQAWTAARGLHAMPRRADIKPAQLKACLPHVTLIDVVAGEPVDFRYRLIGQKLIDGFGGNLTGELHSKHIDSSIAVRPFYETYRHCLATRQAQSLDHQFRNRNRTLVRMRARVWPLSDDGETVTGLFGGGMFLEPSLG